MKRATKRYGFLIGLAAVVVILLYQALLPPNPVHAGKRLSEWMGHLDQGRNTDAWRAAEQAIRAIGAKGLPFIYRMSQVQDSGLKKHLMKLQGKQPWLKFRLTPAADWNARALKAVQILGPQGEPLLPRFFPFVTNLSSSEHSKAFQYAHAMVGAVGRPSVLLLTNLYSTQDYQVRYRLLFLLNGRFGNEAQLALPVLMQQLADPDPHYRQNVAIAIAHIAARDSQILAALHTARLSETNPRVRMNSAAGLGLLGPAASNAVPALKELLNDPHARVRESAANALGAIAPGAVP